MTGTTAAPGLDDARVRAVLDEIARAAERDDQDVMRRAYATAADWPRPPTARQAADLCAQAALPVHPEVGTFLYQLVRGRRPALVVEFGTSFGASTLYAAAALRDNGGGLVIGSELHPGKAGRAREHLARAGLADYAEIRTGDARERLADLPGPPDLVLLDGWKELYLPVLKVLEPQLRAGTLIVSDNLPMLPPEFLDHVRTAGHGYLSQRLPLGEGIEFTVRLQEGPPHR
ncbi:putative methyltransferase [Streptomyces sp. NBRC 110611]|uniref:O-methyltransferase n=1 Tax=Streptomyces sp. NBRC 110611 TaxID=1621259 RepID=UPI000837914C|nr:class I SAM-dependent methyltransferase [Streptomyces sp. NBRC 110611]GAU69233.1 putative methyltransferase [Streptomyces sp. NBRC 110611]